jgi:hypothetical protein
MRNECVQFSPSYACGMRRDVMIKNGYLEILTDVIVFSPLPPSEYRKLVIAMLLSDCTDVPLHIPEPLDGFYSNSVFKVYQTLVGAR